MRVVALFLLGAGVMATTISLAMPPSRLERVIRYTGWGLVAISSIVIFTWNTD